MRQTLFVLFITLFSVIGYSANAMVPSIAFAEAVNATPKPVMSAETKKNQTRLPHKIEVEQVTYESK